MLLSAASLQYQKADIAMITPNEKREQMRPFEGKTVLVTGAAGNLGRAVAKLLADAGASLILVGRNETAIGKLAHQLGPIHVALAVDLADADSVKGKLSAAGLLPVYAVCALAGGFSMGKAVHEAHADDWKKMRQLNVETLLNVVAAVIPTMIERRVGKIVTVGAMVAQAGKARMGPYIVAKSEVMRITETMAGELGQFGINVNSVLPSTIDTPENRTAMPKADPSRWVAPESLAAVIAFLISPEAAAINGALIPVTGRF